MHSPACCERKLIIRLGFYTVAYFNASRVSPTLLEVHGVAFPTQQGWHQSKKLAVVNFGGMREYVTDGGRWLGSRLQSCRNFG